MIIRIEDLVVCEVGLEPVDVVVGVTSILRLQSFFVDVVYSSVRRTSQWLIDCVCLLRVVESIEFSSRAILVEENRRPVLSWRFSWRTSN